MPGVGLGHLFGKGQSHVDIGDSGNSAGAPAQSAAQSGLVAFQIEDGQLALRTELGPADRLLSGVGGQQKQADLALCQRGQNGVLTGAQLTCPIGQA